MCNSPAIANFPLDGLRPHHSLTLTNLHLRHMSCHTTHSHSLDYRTVLERQPYTRIAMMEDGAHMHVPLRSSPEFSEGSRSLRVCSCHHSSLGETPPTGGCRAGQDHHPLSKGLRFDFSSSRCLANSRASEQHIPPICPSAMRTQILPAARLPRSDQNA